MILVIDNYDSFTWNLVHYLLELGAEVEVVRNDAISAGQALSSGARAFLISPGPCTPNEAGVSLDLVAACADAAVPLLGVCLGHQAIGQQFGGRVIRVREGGEIIDQIQLDTGVFAEDRYFDVTVEYARYRELRAFAGTVAHDLKGPLAAVAGWLEAADEEERGLDLALHSESAYDYGLGTAYHADRTVEETAAR